MSKHYTTFSHFSVGLGGLHVIHAMARSILRQCNVLCSSGFVEDAMALHNGGIFRICGYDRLSNGLVLVRKNSSSFEFL